MELFGVPEFSLRKTLLHPGCRGPVPGTPQPWGLCLCETSSSAEPSVLLASSQLSLHAGDKGWYWLRQIEGSAPFQNRHCSCLSPPSSETFQVPAPSPRWLLTSGLTPALFPSIQRRTHSLPLAREPSGTWVRLSPVAPGTSLSSVIQQ